MRMDIRLSNKNKKCNIFISFNFFLKIIIKNKKIRKNDIFKKRYKFLKILVPILNLIIWNRI